MTVATDHVIWFDDFGRNDVPRVGGKNASLSEMAASLGAKGIRVPPGFATTAEAYWNFLAANGLERIIAEALADPAGGRVTLVETGQAIRRAILRGSWPDATAESAGGSARRRTSAGRR